MSKTPPPTNWYPDPNGQDRWWDGEHWTERLRVPEPGSEATVKPELPNAGVSSGGATSAGEPAAGGPRRKWWRPALAGAAAIALLGAGFAAASVFNPRAATRADAPVPTSSRSGQAPDAATPTPTQASRTIDGTLTVMEMTGMSPDAPAGRCPLNDGYEDIGVGAQVTVRDAAGTTVATSTLSSATLIFDHTEMSDDMSGWDMANDPMPAEFPQKAVEYGNCQFAFTAQFPDADFISIEIGHRGGVSFSRAELEAASWAPGLTL